MTQVFPEPEGSTYAASSEDADKSANGTATDHEKARTKMLLKSSARDVTMLRSTLKELEEQCTDKEMRELKARLDDEAQARAFV